MATQYDREPGSVRVAVLITLLACGILWLTVNSIPGSERPVLVPPVVAVNSAGH